MEQIIQQKLIQTAKVVEQQIESEIERLDNLDLDDIEKLREQRLKELKRQSQQKQQWLSMGHGEYSELADEKEFFEVTKKSKDIVCHFYRDSTDRCKIVDMHLKNIAKKHIEAKFCKINVERCPFLTERLRIKVIPTIALIKDSVTKDYIRGFTDLGNCDDFSTEMLEWRIAHSHVINYNGDLLTPPDEKHRKNKLTIEKKRTIRGNDASDDSDIDFND
ncbi:thioredoxin domain-containing protein 9-like [Ctenocephalides felis]|uniref:thioredoxin domain-containing protein 9-like n=1 Tax=Ctenocephalides felis TaxID=7515 RepID=UPI000E6E40E3|nr:thioredoxin domain-containing protein 9-like [Ctenocephalides felis]XP_026461853.1 thioredoxin domain-containing protein 9-like [Ctenocephalides felis]